MHTAIVVLNYNGSALLKQYLPSVVQYADDAEVWVIDNASTDDSVDVLKNDFPQVKIVVNEKNTGYAGGYNDGLEKICADLYLLINSDIEVTENWLTPIKEAFAKNEKLGAAQPAILSYKEKHKYEYAGAAGGFIDAYGYPFCRGRVFDTVEEIKPAYQENINCFWASGACLAVRASVFHQMGGFYSEYFAHMEEIDLCWRIQSAGYQVQCIAKSQVYHLGGGTLTYQSSKKVYLNFRNNLIMMGRLLPSSQRLPTLFTRMVLDGISALRFLLTGKIAFFGAIFNAHIDFYRHWGKINDFRKSHNAKFKQLEGVYPESVVYAYFLKNKKRFSEIIPAHSQAGDDA
jgi:GT2 family glycosyltransferase